MLARPLGHRGTIVFVSVFAVSDSKAYSIPRPSRGGPGLGCPTEGRLHVPSVLIAGGYVDLQLWDARIDLQPCQISRLKVPALSLIAR